MPNPYIRSITFANNAAVIHTDTAQYTFPIQSGASTAPPPTPPVVTPTAPPATPPSTGVLRMPSVTDGSPVTLGDPNAPDQITLLVANHPDHNSVNVFAVAVDDNVVAGPLTVSSYAGMGGGQQFTINGKWGAAKGRKVTIIPEPTGMAALWVNAVTYDLQTFVANGPDPGTNNRPAPTLVNARSLWNMNNFTLDFTLPVAVAGATPGQTVPTGATPATASVISATVDGAARSDTLSNLVTTATTSVALPAGTFTGTARVLGGVAISGAGTGKTIIDGTGLSPAEKKGAFVPQVAGCVISDMTIQNFSISANDGGNAAAVRDDAGGCTLRQVEVTGCQDGICPNDGTWLLDSCDFHDNGAGNAGGGSTHEMYAFTGCKDFQLKNTTSVCGPYASHAVKSRADKTTITGGGFTGNYRDPSGSQAQNAGSVLDFPECGAVTIDGARIVMPDGSVQWQIVGYGMENRNKAAIGLHLALTNCVIDVRAGGANGGVIQSGQPDATLDVTGTTYTGTVAPKLVGWASVTGTITKAAAA